MITQYYLGTVAVNSTVILKQGHCNFPISLRSSAHFYLPEKPIISILCCGVISLGTKTQIEVWDVWRPGEVK